MPIQLNTHTIIEFIRRRPGMYIGNLYLMGFKSLLHDVLEDLLDQCTGAPVFELTFYPDNRLVIVVRPVDAGLFAKELMVFKELSYLEKLGTRVLTALCDRISFFAGERQEHLVATARQGYFDTTIPVKESSGDVIAIDSRLDPTIFKEFRIVYQDILPFLQQFAYLNPSLKIISSDHTTQEPQRNVFHYPEGVGAQLDDAIQQAYYPHVWYRSNIEARENAYHYSIALSNNVWRSKPMMRTFTNNIEMTDGGALENGIIQGIARFLKHIAREQKIKIRASRKEVSRHFGFIAVVKGKDFVYEGCIRTRLGGKAIQQDVSGIVFRHLMNAYTNGDPDTSDLAKRFLAWEGIEEDKELIH